MNKLIRKFIKFLQIYICHKDPYILRLNEYRKAGIKIGEECCIYSSLPMGRDCFLLTIGNNVTISGEVGFINHDNAVIKCGRDATDLLGEIVIGDNCFIGYRSIICPGVHLAENTIVGMGSVVTKNVDTPGLVIAGNPARVICSVKDYITKNESKLVNLDGMCKDDIQKLISQKPYLLIERKTLD